MIHRGITPMVEVALSADQGDKRKHPRLPVNLSATYRSAQLVRDCRVTNLSQTGLSLACGSPDALGTEAEVVVDLPGSDEPLLLKGTVIWVSSDPDRDPVMGLSLDELSKDARAALANFLLRSSYTAS